MEKPVVGLRSTSARNQDLEILYARKAFIEGLIRSIEQYDRLNAQKPTRKRAA